MDRQSPAALAEMPAPAVGSALSVPGLTVDSIGAGNQANQSIAWLPIWVFAVALSAASATAGLFIGGAQGRGLFVALLCFSTLLLAATFDSATGRIPNPITYTAILLGLFVNGLSLLLSRAAPGLADRWLGAPGPVQSLMGFIVFGGIGLVSRALAGLGGGDMKLLAAVGALLGSARAADAMLAALAVAVVYAVANLITGGRVNAAVRWFSSTTLSAIYPRAVLPVGSHRSRTFPLAIPMFLGLLLSVLPPVAQFTARLRGM
jgi:prepilin peptidase CpaA